ncbi:hypothetical protein DV515_00007148 [Chloebia gouldiae]|uniref:Uncharacterized protein n=1 Tax=Chloebia gouldiae TaxID=44316 RepID=A0A3L8SJ22_CHLGU|nr:hypothetical protein DV515_00007148 [Chloebia gouldiae]
MYLRDVQFYIHFSHIILPFKEYLHGGQNPQKLISSLLTTSLHVFCGMNGLDKSTGKSPETKLPDTQIAANAGISVWFHTLWVRSISQLIQGCQDEAVPFPPSISSMGGQAQRR